MKFTDKFRGRYRTAAESREPGYLQNRMAVYARRERMRAAAERRDDREAKDKVVGTIKPKKAASK